MDQGLKELRAAVGLGIRKALRRSRSMGHGTFVSSTRRYFAHIRRSVTPSSSWRVFENGSTPGERIAVGLATPSRGPAAETVTLKTSGGNRQPDYCSEHLDELFGASRAPKRGRRPGSTGTSVCGAAKAAEVVGEANGKEGRGPNADRRQAIGSHSSPVSAYFASGVVVNSSSKARTASACIPGSTWE